MTRQEIEDRKNALASLILDREAKLKEHDYVSAKIADGRATIDEYADVINRALSAIGAPALRNDTDYLSCSRNSKLLNWYYSGNSGLIGGNSTLGNAFPTITLALLEVPQGLNLKN